MLRIYVDGKPELESIIQRLQKGLNTQEILDEGSAVLYNRIRRRFLQETAPDGSKWPKSQAALAREKQGRGGGTLYDTGKMWRSMQLSAPGPNQRQISTDVFYAPYHQYGIGHPRREFLGFSTGDVAVMSQIVVKKIREALEQKEKVIK